MKVNRKGFVLYEIVIYLLISTACFSVIYNELFFTNKLVHQESLELINWHTSMLRLDKMFDGAEIKSCKDDGVTFISEYKDEKKIYTLEKYENMLRIRGSFSGHMPVLVNVKRAKFNFNKNILFIKVTRNNGKVFEYAYKI